MTLFKVGDKVRCVDVGHFTKIKLNEVYQVRWVSNEPDAPGRAIQLEGKSEIYGSHRFVLQLDPETCTHMETNAFVDVTRIKQRDDEPDDAPVNRYTAELKIMCSNCGVRFKFMGLPMEMDLNGAAVSVDGTEARLAIYPENRPSPINLDDQPPGFRIMNNSPRK